MKSILTKEEKKELGYGPNDLVIETIWTRSGEPEPIGNPHNYATKGIYLSVATVSVFLEHFVVGEQIKVEGLVYQIQSVGKKRLILKPVK